MPIRVQWHSLPPSVTHWVGTQLGSPVVRATSQTNGFSSGSADRVRTRDGRGAFVKAVSRDRNAVTLELHRREAHVMRSLPPGVRAPELLGMFDDGEWVALLTAEIDGVHPGQRGDTDIDAVLDAVAEMPLARGPLAALPRVVDEMAGDLDGWERLLGSGAEPPFPSLRTGMLHSMITASAGAADALHGHHLVHLDCRADNILIDHAGAAWMIDWPWASVGPRWLDGLTYLLDVVMRGESVDVEYYLDHPVFESMTPDAADSVLSALAGNWYDKARLPAPSDMPTLRAFQRAEADAAVTWLSRRWS